MITSITSSLRAGAAGRPWTQETGRLTLLVGPPQVGKTRIAQAAELLIRGGVGDAFGRDVSAVSYLKLLTPDGSVPMVSGIFDGKRYAYPGNPPPGARCTSADVGAALTKASGAATTFFASIMPEAFSTWTSELSDNARQRLGAKGLLEGTLVAAIEAAKTQVKSATAAVKSAEDLKSKLGMPMPPVDRAAQEKVRDEMAALLAGAPEMPEVDPAVTAQVSKYDELGVDAERCYADVKRLTAELAALGTEPPAAEGADFLTQWKTLADAVAPWQDNTGCPLCSAEADMPVKVSELRDWVKATAETDKVRADWQRASAWKQGELASAQSALKVVQGRISAANAHFIKTYGSIEKARKLAESAAVGVQAMRTHRSKMPEWQRMHDDAVRAIARADADAGRQSQITNAVNNVQTAKQQQAAWKVTQAELEELQNTLFQRVKTALAAKVAYLMGRDEGGQDFEVAFIEEPLFAVELKRNGRLEAPSGFTSVRIQVALAALMAGDGYALILPDDRQCTPEVMLSWLIDLGERLPPNVQVFVQTTLEAPGAGGTGNAWEDFEGIGGVWTVIYP